jgi:hypothetical protein
MAFSVLTGAQAGGANYSVTTAAMDTSGANLLVANAAWYSGVGAGNNVGVLTDNKSNVWTPLTRRTSTSQTDDQLFYVVNPIVGTGHTFDYTASTEFIYPSLQVLACAGASPSATIDQQNGATGTSIATLATGSITPTQNDELIIAGLQVDCGGVNQTLVDIDSGFVAALPTLYTAAYEGGCLAYLIQTTAATVNPTWNVFTSVNTSLAVSIASFKVVAAAVGGRALVNAGLVNRGLVSAGLVN